MARNEDDDSESLPPGLTRAKLERLARLLRQNAEGLVPAQWEALRYLARANGLSNSPGAVARYLGSTKGTTSQTIMALVRKGFLTKQARGADQRSVSLTLTESGKSLLTKDVLLALDGDIAALGSKTRKRFDKGLDEILAKALSRADEPAFGSCPDCRYFREGGSGAQSQCMKVSVALTDAETALICVEHVRR